MVWITYAWANNQHSDVDFAHRNGRASAFARIRAWRRHDAHLSLESWKPFQGDQMKNRCLCLLATFAASVSFAAEHTLMPTPQTVHIGHFSPTVKPVLTIDSGDIVTLETGANMAPP